MLEAKLYKKVADFIGKEFDCFHTAEKKGIEQGTVDVVGLRYSMDRFGGTAEVVAVEVKLESATFLKSLGQALGYSVMADRCYLAVHKPYNHHFTVPEKELAAQLNVGL